MRGLVVLGEEKHVVGVWAFVDLLTYLTNSKVFTYLNHAQLLESSA